MNEMPTSLSSALGRINKYDGAPTEGKSEKKEKKKKRERDRTEKRFLLEIRSTSKTGRVHVRTDIVEIMVWDLSRAYKFQNISAANEKTIISRWVPEIAGLNRGILYLLQMYMRDRDWFMDIQPAVSTKPRD